MPKFSIIKLSTTYSHEVFKVEAYINSQIWILLHRGCSFPELALTSESSISRQNNINKIIEHKLL